MSDVEMAGQIRLERSEGAGPPRELLARLSATMRPREAVIVIQAPAGPVAVTLRTDDSRIVWFFRELDRALLVVQRKLEPVEPIFKERKEPSAKLGNGMFACPLCEGLWAACDLCDGEGTVSGAKLEQWMVDNGEVVGDG